MLRKIIKIDEEKCDGCGECVPSCAEGAIQIIDGKAKLVADNLCDGLGACLGDCPQDAILIEEREADAFDEEAVAKHLEQQEKPASSGNALHDLAKSLGIGGGCPGSRMMSFAKPAASCCTPAQADKPKGSSQSKLTQWPVQLHLVSTTAPYFQGADLLITADCVPIAYAGYHDDFLDGKAVIMGCPKLDDNQFYLQKMTEIFSKSDIKSITVLKMEVPCCGGISMAARSALAASGKKIPYKEITIGIQGNIKNEASL
ncbi:MAG: 4Fe-4S binding protein [Trichlorobacter sp.]|jgi:NAD-dependent dihydropyrimidine dehydrogenase PreA subunit|nr:4Fe-4S binding protein [Trichlorobacter sp.]